jgi:cystathionine beta-lyase
VKGSDLGYPISPRETPVLELFAERMQSRFAWSVDPRRAEIVSDVVQGIYLAMSLLRGERDGVIVQTPIYPPFLRGVRETGSRLVENRLVFTERGWQVDLVGLHRAVDDGAGVLLLCNPHNPTGRVLTRDELQATARLAVDRDLLVVSDEIHSDLVYAGAEHIPIASLGPGIAARTLTLSSASKAFNIPGLRCAVAHFGSTEMQQRFNQAAPRRSRGGIGILGLSATEAAWRHSDPWLDEVRSYLEANRDFLGAEIARRFPGVRFHSPEASYLAWLDWSAFELEPTPARFFLEHGRVALSDGRLFGAGFESYARINFATSRTLLTQVLDRMQGALSSKGA